MSGRGGSPNPFLEIRSDGLDSYLIPEAHHGSFAALCDRDLRLVPERCLRVREVGLAPTHVTLATMNRGITDAYSLLGS